LAQWPGSHALRMAAGPRCALHSLHRSLASAARAAMAHGHGGRGLAGAGQVHHRPVQRCRNIDPDATLKWGFESTRQDRDQCAGPLLFHLDQPPRITHEPMIRVCCGPRRRRIGRSPTGRPVRQQAPWRPTSERGMGAKRSATGCWRGATTARPGGARWSRDGAAASRRRGFWGRLGGVWVSG